MSDPKQYNPEGAKEETPPEQEVESGAEGPAEQEQLPSVEQIRQYAQDLAARVKAAEEQREKDLEQKLTDREALIAESKRNKELVQVARETLEYFTATQKSGELTDPADVKRLGEIKALVASLEKQRLEIDKKISVLEGGPKVLGKLHEAAEKEDIERADRKESEQALEQLNPQIDQLSQSIKNLAEHQVSLRQSLKPQEQAVHSAWGKIRDLFDRAGNMPIESEFRYTLNRIFEDSRGRTSEEIEQRLSKARKELGMFKGKEKAAIDFILSRTLEFKEYKQAHEGASALEEQLKAIGVQKGDLAEQYRAIILKSWESQNRVNELTGRPRDYNLPSQLSHRLRNHIENFTTQRWRDKEPDSKERILFETYIDIIKRAGGDSLIYHNPKETKEGEKRE